MQTLTIAALVLMALTLMPAAGCRSGEAPGQPGAEQLLSAPNLFVLDVRTPEEFASGHLPKATNVPVGTLSESKSLPADKSTPIVTYFAAGVRAGAAVDELRSLGYTQVTNGGGMAALAGKLGVKPTQGD